MKWLIKLIKLFYTRYIFFDHKGDICLDRYYLLFPPLNDFLLRLPNIYYHEFHEKTNYVKEIEHDHARWGISYVISGGYTESKNWRDPTERTTGSLAIFKPDTVHRIITTQQNTKSVFIVGPRFGVVKFYYRDSMTPIPKSEWPKVGITMGHDAATPEFLKKLDRRRRAYAKLMSSRTLV